MMSTTRQAKGFTLIELVVVIAILAILAAFALPRFASLSEQAHESSIQGTAGALSAGVALAKAQWVTNGSTAATTNVAGFGNDDVDVSDDGWPTGSTADNTNPNMNAGRCQQVWQGLLQANAPTVSTTADAEDYQVTVNGGNCRYIYQPDEEDSFIEYDADTGEITTTIN